MPATKPALLKYAVGTTTTAAGFAMGHAIGPAIRPLIQDIINLAWSHHAVRPPDAGTLAVGVAQGKVPKGQAATWAGQQGIGPTQFKALVDIATQAPALALAFDLVRRDLLDKAALPDIIVAHGLDEDYTAKISHLVDELLDPADLARAIHRGLVPDPGLLQGELPQREGNVPAYPVYDIDALLEAKGSGIDRDRLGVLVGLQGNPMGPHEAAEATFRGIMTEDDYLRAIAEGNTRNEWARAIMEQSRDIPTSRDFLENALRGYRTLDDAIEGAKLHGMSEEHATLIYQNQGRPMIPRQINQAMAWGAKFHPEPGELTDPFEASTVEGSVKPAYYEFYKALRYNLPSAFYFRLLQQQGILTAPEAEKWYLRIGWPPELAKQVATALSRGVTAKSAMETKAELADEYIAGFLTEDEYRAHLTALGFTGEEANLEVLHAEAAAIKTARAAAVTKVRNMYEKADIDEDSFRASLAALGMHQTPIDREVQYANVVKNPPSG